MTFQERAAKGGVWSGVISVVTQGVSWIFTFYVIRLLDPGDYGLMTMAAFLTAYLQIFSGLGLGSAIVQRQTITEGSMDSVFWFSLGVGTAMGLIAFLLAWPTAWLFDEPRVVPVTRLIGALFVVSSLGTVPYNLLTRGLELGKVATVNMIAVLISSIVSVIMARRGYGVYTLIWTNIVLNSLITILLFVASGWRPRLHYSHEEVKPYLRYGLYLAASGAAQRMGQAIDKLIIGKLFGATQLGLYGNAMTIAGMPLDKISPLYQRVGFPLFARLQDNPGECRHAYLQLARYYLLVMSPIYLGSIVVAPELIELVLGGKWLPMSGLFQAVCAVKLFEVLTSYHSMLLNATGRQKSVLRFTLVAMIVVPAAVLVAALRSFEAVIWPWLVVYPLLSAGWLQWSVREARLPVAGYWRAVFDGTKASLLMFAALWTIRWVGAEALAGGPAQRLTVLVGAGAGIFLAFVAVYQRDLLMQAVSVLRSRGPAAETAARSQAVTYPPAASPAGSKGPAI